MPAVESEIRDTSEMFTFSTLLLLTLMVALFWELGDWMWEKLKWTVRRRSVMNS